MEIKYPFQVAAVKRNTKTLGVDAMFFIPETGNSPLEMHAGYSRAVVTIIDKSNATIITKANLPAAEISAVLKKTEIAMEMLMQGTPSVDTEGMPSSPAYTQRLYDKRFKGRTPAEILIANPTDKEALIGVRKWLQDNVARYKNNEDQIVAINDALQLLEIGELKPHSGSKIFSIYSADYKFMKQKDEKGNNLIYEMAITCDPSKKYPFSVSINNFYAPVITERDGRKNIKTTEGVNHTSSTLLMSDMEWFNIIKSLDERRQNFEMLHFPQQFDIAKKASFFGSQD